LNSKTHVQDIAYKLTFDVKRQLNDQRDRMTKLVASIEQRHRIQIKVCPCLTSKQFISSAGARKDLDTKALLDIQCKGLSDEQRTSATKECYLKIAHNTALDDKRLDHIREVQRMEVLHSKEVSDAEVVIRLPNKIANHG
jgi:hypothetical protein